MPPEPGRRLTVDSITASGALHALATEWSALVDRCPAATPFQTPEWILAWWRQFGRGGLSSFAFRDDSGRLVGLAPLYVHGMNGVRVLRLLGAGLSDTLDLLAEPGWEPAVTEALRAAIAGCPERWDAAEFQQLPATSSLRSLWPLDSAEVIDGEPCPVLTIGADARRHGSARLWANVAQDRRRLERNVGRVVISTATSETAPVFFAALRRLHGARWRTRGEPGVLADDEVGAFHRAAGAGLVARGVARLYALRIGERIFGVYYGFCAAGRAYYYLGGFDPALNAYGLGNQLVAHAIEEAAREGARTFDFLRGQESYKYRWGAVDAPTFSLRIAREPGRRPTDVFQPTTGTAGSIAQSVA